jgi:hypothetical protein
MSTGTMAAFEPCENCGHPRLNHAGSTGPCADIQDTGESCRCEAFRAAEEPRTDEQ